MGRAPAKPIAFWLKGGLLGWLLEPAWLAGMRRMGMQSLAAFKFLVENGTLQRRSFRASNGSDHILTATESTQRNDQRFAALDGNSAVFHSRR